MGLLYSSLQAVSFGEFTRSRMDIGSFTLTTCSKFCSELPLDKCMSTTTAASSDAPSSITYKKLPCEQVQLIADDLPCNDALTADQVFPSALRHCPGSCVATKSFKPALRIATAER